MSAAASPVPALPILVDADELIAQAIAHHRVSEFDEARALYHEILRSNPAHPDAHHHLVPLARSHGLRLSLANALIKRMPDPLHASALQAPQSLAPTQPVAARLDQLVALFRQRSNTQGEDAARSLPQRFPARGLAWTALGTMLLPQGKKVERQA